MSDFNSAFRAACAAVGVIDKNVPADGQWHAADLVDDPRGRGDGRIKLFADGKGGIVWNHKTSEKETFFADRQAYQDLTPEQKKERYNQQLQRKVEQKKRQDRIKERQEMASNRAHDIWQSATPAQVHPYLSTKRIQPHNTRVASWLRRYQDETGKWRQKTIKNALLVPMFNGETLCNLQAIFPEECLELGRSKDFLPGGQLKGVFWWIGPKSPEVVCIAEGFATAATIHEQTGYRVYIAFTAGNLLPVGQIVRKNLPDTKIIFCADNDEKTAGNPGLTKANEAAIAVDGFVAVPPVPGDFNDYAAMLGEVSNVG